MKHRRGVWKIHRLQTKVLWLEQMVNSEHQLAMSRKEDRYTNACLEI